MVNVAPSLLLATESIFSMAETIFCVVKCVRFVSK
jgi:hypothetical protein